MRMFEIQNLPPQKTVDATSFRGFNREAEFLHHQRMCGKGKCKEFSHRSLIAGIVRVIGHNSALILVTVEPKKQKSNN